MKLAKSSLSILFIIFSLLTSVEAYSQRTGTILQFTPNNPVGEGKGIHPGRVTWIRDEKSATWNGVNGRWWDDKSINQTALDNMYTKSVMALTGSENIKKAWKKLFQHYNKTHRGINRGWKPGELIAIKVNLNNTFSTNDTDNDIDQSPQATRALIRQLTAYAGVSEEDIIIYDASVGFRQRAIPDRIYRPLHAEFPKVRWMNASDRIPGREGAQWVKGAINYTSPHVKLGNSLPKAVVEATYMINVALLKGHEISGVTLCAKNHFGSIQFPQREHNSTFVNQMRGKEGDYSAFADIMGAKHLGQKTILYIIDGLYGMQTNVGQPQQKRDSWNKMFGGGWCASYFMSQDPVAIESVGLDFLYAEFGNNLGFSGAPQFEKGSSRNCDNYLKEAAKGRNDKYGEYKPDGRKCGSLGVFEHWNNPKDKKYSRNLNKNKGIELIVVKP